MQNEPNFRKSQMNVNTVITMNYEQLTMNYEIKNEPKTNPNEPNLSRRSRIKGKKTRRKDEQEIMVQCRNVSGEDTRCASVQAKRERRIK